MILLLSLKILVYDCSRFVIGPNPIEYEKNELKVKMVESLDLPWSV